jgi:hypothetical protein
VLEGIPARVIRERRYVLPRRGHGVEAKQLFLDAAAGYVASHVRMAAAAKYPPHRLAGHEHRRCGASAEPLKPPELRFLFSAGTVAVVSL